MRLVVSVIDTPELIKVVNDGTLYGALLILMKMKRHTLLMIGQVKRSKMKLY